MKARYAGMESCRAAAVVSGGPKTCTWGCLGLADCARVCEQNAITMDKFGLPVVNAELCTACDDCVDICPKNLFSIEPVTRQLWVACKNTLHGDDAENECEVACNACERCSVDAPEGLITIQDNLAVIDYDKNHLASPAAIERCPTGAIVWFDNEVPRKGANSKKILRNKALPVY
jgi:Fe-S-cluster-containing hydrogenase component 2